MTLTDVFQNAISNDSNLYNYVQTIKEECFAKALTHENIKQGIWTEEEACRYVFADRLRDVFQDEMETERAKISWAFNELLVAAFNEINFQEIADTFGRQR